MTDAFAVFQLVVKYLLFRRGFGQSEEVVGQALSEGNYRQKVVLATKCGLSWNQQGDVFRDSRPETIRKELEASLRRLRTDYIDIYQIH